jgi:DNA gyrase inhibitor GyrI
LVVESLTTVVFSTEVELLPRISAIISISNNTPPTTHTHGCVYQVVVVVVVVFVELELVLVLSWANTIV